MQKKHPLMWAFTALLILATCTSQQSTKTSSSRSPVKDGVYETSGYGKNVAVPITVRTVFANNAIADIAIGPNEETGHIFNTVKELLLPRIIAHQSLEVDGIAGATLSSGGVKTAIAAAIDKAGGNSDEWYTKIPKKTGTVKLEGYDVIVVGLGGAGISAYIQAAEAGAAVFGIEAAGKIGGNSATVGGPMAINSEYIKKTYTGGKDYVNKDALLKQWYADMEAEVPANEVPRVSSVTDPAGKSYPVPNVGKVTPRYQGGPKWELIKKLIDESGKTVTWLAESHQFHFLPPGALGYPQYQIVTDYGTDQWVNGQYTNDHWENDSAYKTIMFTQALEQAKNRNPKNGYKLELRATALLKDSKGRINGVKAVYYDGTTFEIYGRNIILATGGYTGNTEMKNTHYGSNLRTYAVDTARGDGITMAVRDVGAGTYNIAMPAMVHVAQLKNLIYEQINHPKVAADPSKDLFWKQVLSTLALKADNMIVGLNEGQAEDLRGKRFSNEASMMNDAPGWANWKTGGFFAAVYSDDILEKYKTAGMEASVPFIFLSYGYYTPGTPVPDLDDILAFGEQTGNVVRAATLDELADKLKIPAQNLKDTVARYNGYVEQAANKQPVTDEYDKSAVVVAPPPTSGIPPSPPTNYYRTQVNPQAKGFTAVLGAGYYYGSCGGLDVDIDMQVLDTNKQKIPGLYAAGQDSMGVLFHDKKPYVGYGAAAQGWSITSGRLAAAAAAAK
jgi:uncharacterized protein with FMN-binding domain